MKWSPHFIVCCISLLMLFTACHSEKEQLPATNQAGSPGSTLTTSDNRQAILTDLKELKADLAKDGHYDCCVHPPCNWCALKEGECECHDNLKANEEICPGCGLGWHNGNGVVKGVDPKDVKWNIAHKHAEKGGHAH